MGITTREAVAKATAETIWKTCFVPMKWETWDPDVEKLEDVTANAKGEKLYDGSKFTFVMTTGIKAPCTITMKEYESLIFKGAFFKGLVGFEGKILLAPVEEASTKLTYSFSLTGMLGGVMGMINKKAVVEGTEKGLENIVKLSEEASGN